MEIKPFYSGRGYYDITADNGEKYVFAPQEFVEKGFIQDGYQYWNPDFLTPGALSTASVFTLPSDSSLTDSAKSLYKEPTKGLVWKADDFNKINAGNFSFQGYVPSDTFGAIKGYAIKDGVPYYAQATAPGADYTLLDKSGESKTTTITYTVTGGGGGGGFFADLGREILKAGPILPAALNFALPGLGTAVALGTAGGLAATGRPDAALSYGASALVGQLGIGSAVTGATGSTLAGQVASGTTAGLLTGKTPEEALKGGVVGAGAGVVGSTIAGETGSAAAGQLAAGTTAGLLTGKNVEQSLAQGVGNVKLDSLIPDSGVTVANEAQVAAGQTALQDSLAPFLKDTTASAFDTKDIINDSSGFSVSQPTTPITSIPTTPITVNTGGNMATSYKEDPYGYSGGTGENTSIYDRVVDFSLTDEMNAPATELTDTTPYEYSPEEQALIYQINQEIAGTYTSDEITKAIEDYSKGTGLSIKDVVKFFKDNPNLAKSATSLIAGGVGLFGTKLATDTAREAARVAAEAQKFKPVGVTTRFGTTDYTYDAEGNLKTAGYTLTPELKAIQDKLMTGATLSLDEAKKVADLYDPLKKASASLFDLGTSYLAKTPEQVAADYMAKQQDLLAPSRERQLSQLQNTLFQTGRGGLSVGGTGLRPGGGQGLRAASPEMEAYYNALAQSDAALAAGAQQAGQQSVLFGKGLLGAGGEFLGKYTAGQTSAYDPFKTLLSTAGAVESMGAGALDVGTALGGRTTTAAGNAAKTLLPTSSVNPYSKFFTSLADDPEFKAALKSFIGG
jgi:hypothetical protein